jgi:hypothetical protein
VAEQEPLCGQTPHVDQIATLGICFNALGHNAYAQARRNVQESAHQNLGGGVMAKSGHKAGVDLEFIKIELAQVME